MTAATDFSYVLAHVHEGTMISAYGFHTDEEQRDFHEKFSIEQEDERDWEDIPELPAGYHDDPDSDTWVWIEGIRITHVDGEEVEDGRPYL